MNRKKIIENEILIDPNNPLNHYLLAIELRQEMNFMKFETTLDYMLINFKDYLPIYFLYAEYLYQIDNSDKARTLAQIGIEIAKERNNEKVEKELNQLILIND
jgi:hypothetical protein